MIKHAISRPAAGQPIIGADDLEMEPRGRGQFMHIITKVGTTALVALTSLVFGAMVVSHSVAQTDFTLAGKQPKLEREYQEELDTWMLRAYEGDRDAQFKVGVLFTNEQFDRPDFEQAVYWYRQAARQSHVLAQYNLGHQYLSGVGIDKDDIKAMEWWLKAAQQGHALAQFNIGRAYYLGIGVNEDHTQSRDWFERAARNGEPKSIEILEQLGWAEQGQYKEQAAGAGAIGEGIVSNSTVATDSTSKIASGNTPPSTTITNEAVAVESTPKAAPIVTPNAADSTDVVKSPIAIYTDPAVRSVLIAIIDQRRDLKLVEESGTWSSVTSRVGFPVWVHADFITLVDESAVVKGDSVNARSVPIVTNGTIVGRLNRNEQVTVVDKRKDWLRIMSPARFKAWVKTNDFNAASNLITPKLIETSTDQTAQNTASITPSVTDQPMSRNDNKWLFDQSPDSYTLQLASFDDTAKVAEFMSHSRFADNPALHRFTAQGKDIAWTYFLYGDYDDKQQAELAKQEIKQKRAWVRSFGRLQQNRCVAWKKQLPTPKELNTHCVE